MQMRLFLCFFNHCIFVDFYFIFRVFWVFFVFLTVSGKFSGMTVGLNYTGEVKQAAMGLFLPFVLSHIFFNFFVCAFVNICRFGINNDLFCRCTCWPRQPSQLSGCHWGRHGSVYRILGQLPQDLELKKWKQHLKIKIIILTTKPQSKLLKALEDKETERQRTKKWFRSNFFQVLFLALLGFRFPMFKISDDEC